ncbi:MAG: COX15/CtaA family protein [Actinomycetota bacterium]|nr:COX15/CtaA family protein [Actinomycetota bacterium]
MAAPRITPQSYHWVTRATLLSLVGIVVTGASVRLTGSGLGCSDWPNCEPGQLVPASDFHGWVEFGNRLITGVVSIAVILAVSASQWRVPRERKLTLWSLGLVAGVAGQIALGAVTVLTHLSPPIVMAHFLLSMVLVWNAVVLHHAADPDPVTVPGSPAPTVRHCWVIAALASVVVFAGTIVTASGPHGGDEDVDRLGIDLPDAARIHGVSVVVLVATTLWLLSRLRNDDPTGLLRQVGTLLAILAAQATLGYVQYFTEVPALLVAVHIAGATVVWIAVIQLVIAARGSTAPDAHGDGATGSRQPDFAQ